MKGYKNEILFYFNSIKLQGGSCNAITFYNGGASTIRINNFPLIPGDSISYEGNFGEVDMTDYNIEMPSGGALWVLKKVYI